jgi:hypothetical protein
MQIIGNVNDQPAPLLHHDPRGGVPPNTGAQLPKRLGPFRHEIRPPGGIDHQIQPPELLLHSPEQRRRLLVTQIGAHRDAFSAPGAREVRAAT